MTGTQQLIEKIRNAVNTIDYENLTEDQVNNLRIAFDKHLEIYGDISNWKGAVKPIEFNPSTMREGVKGLVQLVLIVQAFHFYHGGFELWESDRGVISISSNGYQKYIGA